MKNIIHTKQQLRELFYIYTYHNKLIDFKNKLRTSKEIRERLTKEINHTNDMMWKELEKYNIFIGKLITSKDNPQLIKKIIGL